MHNVRRNTVFDIGGLLEVSRAHYFLPELCAFLPGRTSHLPPPTCLQACASPAPAVAGPWGEVCLPQLGGRGPWSARMAPPASCPPGLAPWQEVRAPSVFLWPLLYLRPSSSAWEPRPLRRGRSPGWPCRAVPLGRSPQRQVRIHGNLENVLQTCTLRSCGKMTGPRAAPAGHGRRAGTVWASSRLWVPCESQWHVSPL